MASPKTAPAPALTAETIESAILELDARLALGGHDASAAVDRAQLLELLGRKDEAVQAYVGVLAHAPTNVEALNALGLLCLSAGNRDAARTLLLGAVLHGPQHAAAHASLAYVYVLDDRLDGARTLYERALLLDPGLAIAHHGLADLLARLDEPELAAVHRAQGLRHRPVTLRRYRGTSRPVRVLALGSAALGNVATDAFFDDRIFAVASLVVEFDDPSVPLPPHDIVFNAIGEADLCAPQLTAAAAIAARTNAPIINAPAAVAATSRAANAQRLRGIPGVVTPRMIALSRAQLEAPQACDLLAERGFSYPLLLRTPGYHTGEHFVKVDRAGDLRTALSALPGDELLVIEFFDLRDARGDVRKYRAMIVDGSIFPLHLAIARHWKIHYFRADMAESDAHRAEDQAFLTDMCGAIGSSAVAALERVRDVLALDYGGIDFALDGAGRVVVFEANASMIVPQPDADHRWDYRRPGVARIHGAVHAMLMARAAATH